MNEESRHANDIFKDFRVGSFRAFDIPQDMEEPAEHITDALRKFIRPFISPDNKGIETDDPFTGEEVLQSSQQAVGKFPEYIDNEKSGKNHGPGVILASNHIEERHG